MSLYRLILPLAALLCSGLILEDSTVEEEIPTSKSIEQLPMEVLHVLSEFGSGAGTALNDKCAITAAHNVSGIPAANVDSLPMIVPKNHWKRLEEHSESSEDWVPLEGTRPRFRPNPIDPKLELEPGDKVLIGGFYLAKSPPQAEDFMTRRADFVEGTVIDPKSLREPLPDLVYIQVPDNDYHGFCGGPAGRMDHTGKWVVFGITVVMHPSKLKQTWDNGETKTTNISIIGILRMPIIKRS
ncbi:MAG: hypothetical protein DCC75_01165 [Proteobacteria bacterium]|nr:MAG: hypothetical protein DCC75_01165 [Pseudomonadota bacterium]